MAQGKGITNSHADADRKHQRPIKSSVFQLKYADEQPRYHGRNNAIDVAVRHSNNNQQNRRRNSEKDFGNRRASKNIPDSYTSAEEDKASRRRTHGHESPNNT